MDEKVFKFNRFAIVLFIVGICVAIGGIFFLGRLTAGVGRDNFDSERDAEYGRRMGLAAETIRGIDNGLGDIQGNVARIAVAVGQGAEDLRGYAKRLLDIAGEVKEMEDSLSVLRDRVWDFLDDYGDNNSDEVEAGESQYHP
jgi:hypothetical protein